MRTNIPVLLFTIGLSLGCERDHPNAKRESEPSVSLLTQGAEGTVTIVGKASYYVSGIPHDEKRGIFYTVYTSTNNMTRKASGIMLEIVKPSEYAGKIYTMHDDDFSADLYFAIGYHYELTVRARDIGTFTFGPCNAIPFRKVDFDESASK